MRVRIYIYIGYTYVDINSVNKIYNIQLAVVYKQGYIHAPIVTVDETFCRIFYCRSLAHVID